MEVCRTALGDAQTVSTTVVEAVADALATSPMELDPPLYRAVDPDALNDLFDPKWDAAEATRVTFSYADCEVSVNGGEVVVRPATGAE